jgi:hypothetical protein
MVSDAVSVRGRQPVELPRPVELVCFGLCIAQLVYLLASLIAGSWILDSGRQRIATDFVNVWASGGALAGDPAAVYDVVLHKQAEVAALGHPFSGEYPWIYPPTFLFVATWLAMLPFVLAYAAWIAVTFSAYVAGVRAILAHRAGVLLACAYPGILSNIVVGQNGFATAALIGWALVLLERQPIFAGCCIGLLSFKPHLGVLFPLVLASGRHWRALLAAVGTVVLLALASCFAFGIETWHAFFQSLPVASQASLTDGRADWAKLQSVFAVVRLMGGGASLAWAVHFSFAAAIAIVLCVLWQGKIAYQLKAAALATGTLLVTPYLFLYDLVVLALPIAFLIRVGLSTGFLPGELPAIAFASMLVLVFPLATAPVGLAAIVVVALLIAIRIRHAASGPDGFLRYQGQPPSWREASSGRSRIAAAGL